MTKKRNNFTLIGTENLQVLGSVKQNRSLEEWKEQVQEQSKHSRKSTKTSIIEGIFFGQAIGDALGLGTEFMSKKQVAAYYPDGYKFYNQMVQDHFRSRFEAGNWTDDTDQFLCIVDSILAAGGVDAVAFAKELRRWFATNPQDIGTNVFRVVSRRDFEQFPFRASQAVWEESGREAAANGALMRTTILGAWQFWDADAVRQNTETIAKVTHWDPRCIGSCVIVTSIISTLLREGEPLSLNKILKIANRYDERIAPFVIAANDGNIEKLKLDEPNSIGYTLKTLSAALWAYFNVPAKHFEKGILAIINQGGDADTNAAVAGSLLGAKFGCHRIPEKLIEGLNEKALLAEKCNAFIKKMEENQKDCLTKDYLN